MSSSICIFTHHYHPQLSGIGNFVDGLAHALTARGDRVVIVTNDFDARGSRSFSRKRPGGNSSSLHSVT